jgi:hypothetical protein
MIKMPDYLDSLLNSYRLSIIIDSLFKVLAVLELVPSEQGLNNHHFSLGKFKQFLGKCMRINTLYGVRQNSVPTSAL